MRTIRTTLAIGLIASLSGCGFSFLSDRETNPVIEDDAYVGDKKFAVFSTTASRRTILMTGPRAPGAPGEVRICAEPPPDVGETFAKALLAQIAKTSKDESKSSATLATVTATAISPLLYRSQGLQLYRDSVHTLCQALMNKDITVAEFLVEHGKVLQLAGTLVAAEVAKMDKITFTPSVQTAPTVTLTAPPGTEVKVAK